MQHMLVEKVNSTSMFVKLFSFMQHHHNWNNIELQALSGNSCLSRLLTDFTGNSAQINEHSVNI